MLAHIATKTHTSKPPAAAEADVSHLHWSSRRPSDFSSKYRMVRWESPTASSTTTVSPSSGHPGTSSAEQLGPTSDSPPSQAHTTGLSTRSVLESSQGTSGREMTLLSVSSPTESGPSPGSPWRSCIVAEREGPVRQWLLGRHVSGCYGDTSVVARDTRQWLLGIHVSDC